MRASRKRGLSSDVKVKYAKKIGKTASTRISVTATLIFEISTDLNPAGKQEYTSPGCYELNSGAVLKFTYNGKKYSAHTLPITVLVVDSIMD